MTVRRSGLHEPANVGTKKFLVPKRFFTPHMEQYLRIKAESFEVLAKLPDGEVVLTFVAVANTGTGETVGDTSQFVARADWLAGSGSFDAVLSEVSVRGKVYRSIGFNYPEGN